MIYEVDTEERQYPIKGAVMQGNLPFMNHCHQEMEILQILRGSLSMTVEGEEFRLKEGDICMIPPFVSHSIGKSSQNCERLAILMDLKLIGNWTKEKSEWMWAQNELGGLDLFSGHWKAETVDAVQEIIRKLYQEVQQKEFAWQFAVKTLVCELVLTAIRQMPRCEKKQQPDQMVKLKDILEYIALHYCSDLTLGGCADAVGFNSTYLSRYFSKHMGITFQEYVKRLRVDKAKWLLMTERISITEVCFESGFRDVKTFNKLFRSECGMSPTEFKKSLMNDGGMHA